MPNARCKPFQGLSYSCPHTKHTPCIQNCPDTHLERLPWNSKVSISLRTSFKFERSLLWKNKAAMKATTRPKMFLRGTSGAPQKPPKATRSRSRDRLKHKQESEHPKRHRDPIGGAGGAASQPQNGYPDIYIYIYIYICIYIWYTSDHI